jgi:hypothetical protein
MEITNQMIERFWTMVDIRGANDCWEWKGVMGKTRYGAFGYKKGRHIPASRFALYTKIGELPSDILACHTCDNPPCCNPAHLFPGTQKDNVADAMAKGRRRSRPKITDEIVKEVRRLWWYDQIYVFQIANNLHIPKRYISQIMSGKIKADVHPMCKVATQTLVRKGELEPLAVCADHLHPMLAVGYRLEDQQELSMPVSCCFVLGADPR